MAGSNVWTVKRLHRCTDYLTTIRQTILDLAPCHFALFFYMKVKINMRQSVHRQFDYYKTEIISAVSLQSRRCYLLLWFVLLCENEDKLSSDDELLRAWDNECAIIFTQM